MKQYLTSQGLQTLWNQIKALFVAKEAGKGLSSNDYTTAEKNKLSGIVSGAEVNTIVAVQRNGTAITPKDRVVNILVPVKTSELNNDSTYQTAADVAETIVGVKLDLASGIITLTRKNGTTFTLDLPTEKIIKSGRYDNETKEIVLVLEDESEIRFSASELIDEYYADESTLELYTDTADGNKKKFRIKTAYKNKIDGSEQTTNKTASVSSISTETQYPTAKAVYNAVKDLATKVQTFATASTRANIESGETIATIFGKIRKWFADLKAVAFTGSYNDLSDRPSIGNGKVTIKQKGVEKGSFSLNQTGNANIELTDENTTYGIATSATAGLVKSGGDITVANDGTVSVTDKLSKRCGWCITNVATPYWFLIAEYTCTLEWFDLNTTFIASRNFYGAQAVLMASMRTNTMGKIEFCQLRSLSKVSDFPVDCFAIAFKGTAGSKAEFQIWAKCTSQYYGMSIMPIYFGTRTQISNSEEYWTLKRINETYTELRADVRADGLFTHPNGFSISLCQVPEYRKLSGSLEITDSNLATYFNSSTGVLTISNGVTTILFNTNYVQKVFSIVGTCAVNGYRLSIAGRWQPAEKTSSSTTGCFSSYIYGYRGGAVSYGTQYSSEMREAFEDFIYFNGVWYSKAY